MKRNNLLSTGKLMVILLLFGFISCRAADEGAYANWDADSDARLDTNEFGTAWGEAGYYDRWDANQDNFIDENEWNAGRNEFMEGYNETEFGAFGDWDTDDDNLLAENELRDGVFGVYDANNDNYWDDTEYGTWWGTFNGGL